MPLLDKDVDEMILLVMQAQVPALAHQSIRVYLTKPRKGSTLGKNAYVVVQGWRVSRELGGTILLLVNERLGWPEIKRLIPTMAGECLLQAQRRTHVSKVIGTLECVR
jgi:hypothetical protein